MNAPTAKRTKNFKFFVLFYMPFSERYSVLCLIGVLSGGNIAFLREEGGTEYKKNIFFENIFFFTECRKEPALL